MCQELIQLVLFHQSLGNTELPEDDVTLSDTMGPFPPQWRCYAKLVNPQHVFLTLLPAAFSGEGSVVGSKRKQQSYTPTERKRKARICSCGVERKLNSRVHAFFLHHMARNRRVPSVECPALLSWCGAAHIGFAGGPCGVELFASCSHLDCFPRGVVNEWIKKIANGMVWESLCFWALALVWLPLSHW